MIWKIQAAPNASQNACLGSDFLLKLTLWRLYSTLSHTLLEAPSDYNSFCWCTCYPIPSRCLPSYSTCHLPHASRLQIHSMCHWATFTIEYRVAYIGQYSKETSRVSYFCRVNLGVGRQLERNYTGMCNWDYSWEHAQKYTWEWHAVIFGGIHGGVLERGFIANLEIYSKADKRYTSSNERLIPARLAYSECTLSVRGVRDTWWQLTLLPASIPPVALPIALRSLFHCSFLFCRSAISDEHSVVVANCDHTSDWVHWVHPCIWIAMRWGTQRKSLLVFVLPPRKMQLSLH